MPKLQSHEIPLLHMYSTPRRTLMRYRHPNNGKRRERCNARMPEWNEHWKCVDYGVCAEIAEWKYGDQLVCHFHGGMVVGGTYPLGIHPDGKWQ